MTRLIINGEEFEPHSEDDEPAELRLWREADKLIKEGKLQEAADRIRANVDPKGEPLHSTLVFRVIVTLQRHNLLDGWESKEAT